MSSQTTSAPPRQPSTSTPTPAPAGPALPTWPQIVVTVRPDATGEVLLDGTSHPVAATDVDQARVDALAIVREHGAVAQGRAVRMDTDDHGQLIVHPDGRVEAAEDGAPVTQPRPAPAPRDQPRLQQVWPSTAGARRAPAATIEETAGQDEPETRPAAPGGEVPWLEPTSAEDAPAATGAGEGQPAAQPARLPQLGDLIAARPAVTSQAPQWGWQARAHRWSGGLVRVTPSTEEVAHRQAVEQVQRRLTGPKTVVVVNPKGGAHKTTTALLLAATLGIHRGGSTLAWDNNETRGTLGWRAQPADHTRTAVDLLDALPRITAARAARVGDLDDFVRPQGWGHFDVLASPEDAASAATIDAVAFRQLHEALSCFYRIMVVDTGNNMHASNWQAALEVADQLVVISTVREDTAQSAAWLADALRATGHEDLVRGAVTVLTAPARSTDAALDKRVRSHFAQLTRAVVSVPHDPALVAGGPIDYPALSSATREAWLRVTAAVAEGL